MSLKLKPTWRELRSTLLILLAIAITILLIAGGSALWKRQYALGVLLMVVGLTLGFLFFRKWKLDLIIIGLVWIMVNAGVTVIGRPSTAGVLITLGSALGLVLVGRWKANRLHRTPQA